MGNFPALRLRPTEMVLSRQLHADLIVFLDQRTAGDLGGMGGENQLDIQPGDRRHQRLGTIPGLGETLQQPEKCQILLRLGLVRPASAHAVVLLGDVGQVEELVERAGHRQQLRVVQRAEVFRQLPAPFRAALARRLSALAHALDLVEERVAHLPGDGLPEQFTQLVNLLAQACIDCHGISFLIRRSMVENRPAKRGGRRQPSRGTPSSTSPERAACRCGHSPRSST
ncbi:hypothetical protein D9M71_478480 [compost metagenome]